MNSNSSQLSNPFSKKIEKIWKEFKMDEKSMSDLKSLEFNNRFEKKRVRSAQVGRSGSARRSKSRTSFQYEWFPRVTIPEPFSMTIREQIKSEQKQKLVREMQDEREKRIDAEIRECSRKFRANPVPAHVYLPLYEKHKVG
jgi:protein FAM161A